jgi:hypothetical protein
LAGLTAGIKLTSHNGVNALVSIGASCRHFADKLFTTPWHRVVLPDTKVALGQDEKTQIAIWSDGVARYASYF